MKKRAAFASVLLVGLLSSAAAAATTTIPLVTTPGGSQVAAQPMFCVDQGGSYVGCQAGPFAAATSTALTGTSTGTGLVGPFTPTLGRDINLKLVGVTGGTVQLLRSSDGTQASAKPITVLGTVIGTYTADCQEQGVTSESEATAAYWLSLPAAGIAYRVSQ